MVADTALARVPGAPPGLARGVEPGNDPRDVTVRDGATLDVDSKWRRRRGSTTGRGAPRLRLACDGCGDGTYPADRRTTACAACPAEALLACCGATAGSAQPEGKCAGDELTICADPFAPSPHPAVALRPTPDPTPAAIDPSSHRGGGGDAVQPADI